MKKIKGFTLVELLVVIFILTLMLATLATTLSKVKERAYYTLCANNIRNILISLDVYALENDYNLPLNKQTSWLYDISYSTTDFVMETGGEKKTFYCPCDKTHDPDDPKIWQFSQVVSGDNGPEPLGKTERDEERRITSYFWLMDLVGGRYPQPSGSGSKEWVRKTTCKRPTETELVCDVTFSDGVEGDSNFSVNLGQGGGSGGMLGSLGIVTATNHMESGEPIGGYTGFVDGHLDWRRFEDMEARYIQGGYHWW